MAGGTVGCPPPPTVVGLPPPTVVELPEPVFTVVVGLDDLTVVGVVRGFTVVAVPPPPVPGLPSTEPALSSVEHRVEALAPGEVGAVPRWVAMAWASDLAPLGGRVDAVLVQQLGAGLR